MDFFPQLPRLWRWLLSSQMFLYLILGFLHTVVYPQHSVKSYVLWIDLKIMQKWSQRKMWARGSIHSQITVQFLGYWNLKTYLHILLAGSILQKEKSKCVSKIQWNTILCLLTFHILCLDLQVFPKFFSQQGRKLQRINCSPKGPN